VLASTLLGMEPPELPVAQLVHTAGLFGITENTVARRPFPHGGFRGGGDRRRRRYRLAGHLLERQRRQRASRAAQTTPLERDVGPGPSCAAPSSSARSTQRPAGASSRGRASPKLREGCWLRPANLELALEGTPGADLLAGSFVPPVTVPPSPRACGTCRGGRRRAETLRLELAALALGGPEDLAPGFVLSAAVLRHFQADPLLPDGLLAPDWPGAVLRAELRRVGTGATAACSHAGAARGRQKSRA